MPNLCRHLQRLLTLLSSIAFRFEYSYKSAHIFLLLCSCCGKQFAFNFLISVAKLQTLYLIRKQFAIKIQYLVLFCLFSVVFGIKKGRSKVQKHFIPAYFCVVFFHAARLCRRWDDVLDEILMQMVVGGQFGMESGGELMSLSNRHDMSVHL